jgi:hypothetical protein
MSTISTTRVDLEHPYQAAGIVVILLSFVTLAFTLGVLARCGGGSGVCFDASAHAAGSVGLVIFALVFILGVALLAYTGSSASFQTQVKAPAPPTPVVTNVITPAPAAPTTPAVTNVYGAPAAPVPTTVVVAPRA